MTTEPSLPPLPFERPIVVAALRRDGPLPLSLSLTEEEAAQTAKLLDVDALSALSASGSIAPSGEGDWLVSLELSAKVEQRCVVTLEPIVSEISQQVERLYVPRRDAPETAPDELEADMPEVFSDRIEIAELVLETLALAIEPYPRRDGAEFGSQVAGPPQAEPLTDEAMRPFAGLAALKRKMEAGD